MSVTSQHAFSEKVALVTDITSADGRATAMQLALCGAFVIGVRPFGAVATAEVETMRELGTLAIAAEESDSGEAGIEQVIEVVNEAFGRLDLLLNCTDPFGLKIDQSRPFQNLLEKLTESVFLYSTKCKRLMDSRPSPRIVNLFYGSNGLKSAEDAGLNASSGAILELTKSLPEYLGRPYRVNGVRVSRCDLDNDESIDRESLLRKPLGIDADDVARAVMYLFSSESKALNGNVLEIS
ncbi:MAG: SDR family oxidoreductase [Pyrinomonadaceae bacterium]